MMRASESGTTTGVPRTLLTEDLLSAVAARAPVHDRENTFPEQDLADLRAAGYLTALVPVERGGAGLSLAEVAHEQARLAGAAPATALAVNMHLVVTGVAAQLHRRGDHGADFVLDDAVAGEVFAFGSSEAGNDQVLLDSRTRAEPAPDGGYRLHGTKIFTTLSPVWTRLATFGRDDSDPADPRMVHGVVSRSDGGVTSRDDWDTLGMRATRSCTTVLDGAVLRPERVLRRLPPGPTEDAYVGQVFAVFEVLVAAVYTGIGRRALHLAVDAARRRGGGTDPDLRRRVAEAAIAQDGIEPQVWALAAEADRRRAPSDVWWSARLVGLKVRATETARQVVEQAVRVCGGRAYSADQEVGRLYRDVLAGLFHPSDDRAAHATVAQAWLDDGV